MATLNLETFNNILIQGLKDQSPKGILELLEAELKMCTDIFIDAVGAVMDELDENGYDSDNFRKVKQLKEYGERLIDFMTVEEIDAHLIEIVSASVLVLDDLDESGYDSDLFRRCHTIRRNTETLLAQAKALETQIKEEENNV